MFCVGISATLRYDVLEASAVEVQDSAGRTDALALEIGRTPAWKEIATWLS